jgi:DNA gyrase/topoisomerase IV subunit A
MIITNEGTIIRTSVENINVYSRTAAGVIVMRLAEGAYINNIARLEKTEEIEKESLEVDKEIENTPKPEVKEKVTSDFDSEVTVETESEEETF